MLAGTVVSALIGGLAGLAFSITQEHSLLQTLFAYQIGGLVALTTFVAAAQPFALRRD